MAATVFAVAAGGVVAGLRLTSAPPLPVVELSSATEIVPVPGTPPAVPIPVGVSLALDSGGPRVAGPTGASERLAAQDADHARPIASVAKVLTALTVLSLQPLHGPGDEGPPHIITSADVADYLADLRAGGSVVPVSQGEVFTERQLLLALLLPSGNNIAETLARLAAGSRAAFLAKANAQAAQLGMTATRMTDPSGFDPGTVSTASDLVRLGSAAIGNPTLAALVAVPSLRTPGGTTFGNLDTGFADVPGWLGIKTGNSDGAGGCLLFAARRSPDGDAEPADGVTVVGAVLGVHSRVAGATGADDRGAAIAAAEQAVTAALGSYHAASAAAATPPLSGMVTAAWGPSAAVTLGHATTAATIVARAGQRLRLVAVPVAAAAPLGTGAVVGHVDALVPGGGSVVASWPVMTLDPIPGPDWTWRLRNGQP